ncbi:MAG: pilus assembly protein PilM [Candidatus Omnitrophota bacterium]|jgi:type IV pilus assembly protein PilM
MPNIPVASWIQTVRDRFPGLAGKPAAAEAVSRLLCDIGDHRWTLAQIDKLPGTLTLTSDVFQIPKPALNDEGAAKFASFAAASGFVAPRARLSLRGCGVVIRFIQFPRMKPEELRQALQFEAEKYIPFKASEVLLDHFVLPPRGAPGTPSKDLDILLVAIKRDEIYPLLNFFRTARLPVEIVDLNALALLNALSVLCPETQAQTVGVLDIGSAVSTLAIASQGSAAFIRDISFGELDLAKRLKLMLGLSEDKIAELMRSTEPLSPEAAAAIKEAFKGLESDLKISLNYFSEQIHAPLPVSGIYLAGGWSHQAVAEILTQTLGIEVKLLDLTGKVVLRGGLPAGNIARQRGYLPVLAGLAVRRP